MKKLKFNNKIITAKKLNNENVNYIGNGTDDNFNFYYIFKDKLNIYYYIIISNNKEIVDIIKLYLEDNINIFTLLELRGMLRILNMLYPTLVKEHNKLLRIIDRKIFNINY